MILHLLVSKLDRIVARMIVDVSGNVGQELAAIASGRRPLLFPDAPISMPIAWEH